MKEVTGLLALTVLLLVIPGFGYSQKICDECRGNWTTLNLMVLVSQTRPTDLSTYIPGMKVALDAINSDCSILPCYYLNHTELIDPQCSDIPGVRGFIEHVTNPSLNEIMIIGADCSVSTQPVASLSPFWNLVQISTVSTSPRLSIEKEFPYFLRLVGPDSSINPGLVELMTYFKWEHLAIITQEEDIFTFTRNDLLKYLEEQGLHGIHSSSFPTGGNPQDTVLNLKRSSGRIIFLNAYHEYGLEILCQAATLGMTSPEYAWITYGWYLNDFWKKNKFATRSNYEPFTDCTVQQIMSIVDKMILIDHYPRYDKTLQKTAVGNLTLSQYWNKYQEQQNITGLFPGEGRPDQKEDSVYLYDAVWVTAKALHQTDVELRASSSIRLEDFWTSNLNTANMLKKMIYANALNTTFYGLSGDLSFLQNGDRLPELRFFQYRRKENILERIYFGNGLDGSLMIFSNETNNIYPDGIPQSFRISTIGIPLFAIYTVIAILGILYGAFCLVFNLVFRNKMVVKLSSPYINALFISGIMTFYFLVILLGLDSGLIPEQDASNLCMARVWISTLAFTLIYGSILAKTFRVFLVFRNARSGKPTQSQLVIKEIHMLCFIGLLLGIDLLYLIIVTAIPVAVLHLETRPTSYPEGDLPAKYTVCYSPGSNIWIPILLAYKGFEVIFGLIFAFETRKIKVQELNDSRMIVFSLYAMVVAALTLTPISLLLNDKVVVVYAVQGASIFITLTLLLTLNFVPKMFYMYKNPSGEVKMDFSNIVKTWTKGDHNKKSANTTSLAQSASIEQTVESKIEPSEGTHM